MPFFSARSSGRPQAAALRDLPRPLPHVVADGEEVVIRVDEDEVEVPVREGLCWH